MVIISKKVVSLYSNQKLSMEKNKKCTGCKGDFPLSRFYKNKLIHDGHSNYCIDCTKVNSKKYFQKKKERTYKVENENLLKMVLLNNCNHENNSPQADNIMKILMIEKMCKSVLEEVENLKRSFVKTESEVVE